MKVVVDSYFHVLSLTYAGRKATDTLDLFYSFLLLSGLKGPIAFAVRALSMIAASGVESFAFPELLPVFFFVFDSFVLAHALV